MYIQKKGMALKKKGIVKVPWETLDHLTDHRDTKRCVDQICSRTKCPTRPTLSRTSGLCFGLFQSTVTKLNHWDNPCDRYWQLAIQEAENAYTCINIFSFMLNYVLLKLIKTTCLLIIYYVL